MKNLLAIGTALLAQAAAHGQSFNIDFGPAGSSAPPPRYAAAGQAGRWISLPGTQGVNYLNLVDVNGAVTPVRMNQIGGTDTVTVSDPPVTGDHAVLMNDFLITHTAIENCLFFHDMEPGPYEVIVYARMPAQPGILCVTNVDEEPGNPHYPVGGAWAGQHELYVSYAVHYGEVAASGPNAGLLRAHSGVPSGGDYGIGAALNGIQIRRIEVAGDLDGDGHVGFADLSILLNAWGICPPACAADLDGNLSVGFADLNLLLANWG